MATGGCMESDAMFSHNLGIVPPEKTSTLTMPKHQKKFGRGGASPSPTMHKERLKRNQKGAAVAAP